MQACQQHSLRMPNNNASRVFLFFSHLLKMFSFANRLVLARAGFWRLPQWQGSKRIPRQSILSKGCASNLAEYFANLEASMFKSEINQQRPSVAKFIPYENLFAYYGIRSSEDFPRNIGKWDIEPTSTTLADLQRQSQQLFQRDGDCEPSLVSQMKRLTVEETVLLMNHLLNTIPFVEEETEWSKLFLLPPYIGFWQSLDDATVSHLHKSNLDQDLSKLLAISGLWFELGLSRNIQYNHELIKFVVDNRSSVDKMTFKFLMFNLNLLRRLPPMNMGNFYSIMDHFLNQKNGVEKLNLDELSLVAMAFFKTQTRMPFAQLVKFISRAEEELTSGGSNQSISTISVVSILKMIRFSIETIEFDVRKLQPQLSSLINTISVHKENLLQSNICLTYLCLLKNSALIYNPKLYNSIFERMMANLSAFRIKDIEKILYCFANTGFDCPNRKLKQLEEYLVGSDEAHIYSQHTYNIAYYLLAIKFYPHKLITLIKDERLLKKTTEESKFPIHNTMLLLDSILRLEMNTRLLNEAEINHTHQALQSLFCNSRTKKSRILNAIETCLASQHSEHFRMMYLFPFSTYPFPVILTPEVSEKIAHLSVDYSKHRHVHTNSIPYQLEHLRPDTFKGCTVIVLLLNKDFIVNSLIRGFMQVNIRLLRKLGFRVVLIEQRRILNGILDSSNSKFHQNQLASIIERQIRNQK